jgi:hypothetical protein
MACENCSDELRSAYRHHNRVLRTVNKNLRARATRIHEKADELFASLCETNDGATEAFGELWGSALFDCGPEDYNFMVEDIKKAFAELEGFKKAQTQA